MASPRTVHVFTKCLNVASSLRRKLPDIKVVEIPYIATQDDSCHTTPSKEELDQLRDAEILLGDPVILADGVIEELVNLKWMQSTWTGCEALMSMLEPNKPLPTFQLTRGAGLYDAFMAEWVIAQMIARERNFDYMKECQKQSKWSRDNVCSYRSLPELSIGIIGLGGIGKEIARVCKAFHMTVWGVTRRAVEPSKRSPHVDTFILQDQLPELLKSCDYVCNVLPSTPATRGLLSGDVLKVAVDKKPVFMNVGRGDVIDEGSLLNALRQEWISGAILDVLPEEPLPSSSPLWTAPNVVITPHVSGTGDCAESICNLFVENFKRFTKGEPLKHVLSWELGY